MKIERVWSLIHRWTFTIKPIKKLLQQEMNGGVWLDPMAGYHSPAHVTNDINPDCPTDYHMDALEFLEQQPNEEYDGILWDPPYSEVMARRKYHLSFGDTVGYQKYLYNCRFHLARIIKPGGKAISFGWNSTGLGKCPSAPKKYRHHRKAVPYFEIYRIMLINHGAKLYDTIVTCQRKVQTTL